MLVLHFRAWSSCVHVLEAKPTIEGVFGRAAASLKTATAAALPMKRLFWLWLHLLEKRLAKRLHLVVKNGFCRDEAGVKPDEATFCGFTIPGKAQKGFTTGFAA